MPTDQHKSFKDMNWVERNLVYPFARGGPAYDPRLDAKRNSAKRQPERRK